mgnify:CR=1 FL=1
MAKFIHEDKIPLFIPLHPLNPARTDALIGTPLKSEFQSVSDFELDQALKHHSKVGEGEDC